MANAMIVRVVDDNEDIAQMIKLMLQREGIAVMTTVIDESCLLHRCPWVDVDAALVDLTMPGISGEEVLRYLHEHFPDIRRVVLTAAIASVQESVYDLADCVLGKPATADDILSAIGWFTTDGG